MFTELSRGHSAEAPPALSSHFPPLPPAAGLPLLPLLAPWAFLLLCIFSVSLQAPSTAEYLHWQLPLIGHNYGWPEKYMNIEQVDPSWPCEPISHSKHILGSILFP